MAESGTNRWIVSSGLDARLPRCTARPKSAERRSRCSGGSTLADAASVSYRWPVRPTTRCGPCADEQPGSPGLRGSACAAGSRGSWPVGGCSAGRCACSLQISWRWSRCTAGAGSTARVLAGRHGHRPCEPTDGSGRGQTRPCRHAPAQPVDNPCRAGWGAVSVRDGTPRTPRCAGPPCHRACPLAQGVNRCRYPGPSLRCATI